MAQVNFPATAGQPTDGSFQYTENGVTYTWNGTYWAANNASDLDDRFVNVSGDTMTGDLVMEDSDITLENSAGDTTIQLNASTGDIIATGDVQMTSLNSGPLGGLRNQVINSCFDFWYRSTDGNGTGYQSADRWRLASTSPRLRRVVVSAAAAAAGIPCTYAGALSGTPGSITQVIELPHGSGRPGPYQNGSQWTLSFYTNEATLANVDVGSMSFVDDSSLNNSSNAFTKSPVRLLEDVGEGWFRYAVTFTVDQPINGSNQGVKFTLGSPTDGTEIQYTGIQLEIGSVATPLEIRPLGLELQLAQRYYYKRKSRDYSYPSNSATGGQMLRISERHPVEMRAIPNVQILGGTAVDRASTMLDPTSINTDGMSLQSTGAAGDGAMGYNGVFWEADAEL